jgi:hypothetical protein
VSFTAAGECQGQSKVPIRSTCLTSNIRGLDPDANYRRPFFDNRRRRFPRMVQYFGQLCFSCVIAPARLRTMGPGAQTPLLCCYGVDSLLISASTSQQKQDVPSSDTMCAHVVVAGFLSFWLPYPLRDAYKRDFALLPCGSISASPPLLYFSNRLVLFLVS